jgi:hypothetical protein
VGSWRDQDQSIRNYYYQQRKANERIQKQEATLPPIGATDPESGKLIVGYRSRAGRLGKYLLLSERAVVYGNEKITFVTLGFIGGRSMADGRTGFDARGEFIYRSEEDAKDAESLLQKAKNDQKDSKIPEISKGDEGIEK